MVNTVEIKGVVLEHDAEQKTVSLKVGDLSGFSVKVHEGMNWLEKIIHFFCPCYRPKVTRFEELGVEVRTRRLEGKVRRILKRNMRSTNRAPLSMQDRVILGAKCLVAEKRLKRLDRLAKEISKRTFSSLKPHIEGDIQELAAFSRLDLGLERKLNDRIGRAIEKAKASLKENNPLTNEINERTNV